jgi:hypothetical protein
MRHSKEKVPKKGVRPSVSALILMAVAAAILSPMLLPVSAQEEPGNSEGHGTPRESPGQPPDPDCWGEVTSTFAQVEDRQPGIGEHASSFDEPRFGIGNNQDGDDTPPEHGANVGQVVGGCEADRNDP